MMALTQIKLTLIEDKSLNKFIEQEFINETKHIGIGNPQFDEITSLTDAQKNELKVDINNMDENVRNSSFLFKSSFSDAFKNTHGHIEAVFQYDGKKGKKETY